MDSMHQLLISIQENKDYRFPRQELEQLIQNRDQSIPVLLDYLQDVIKNFDDYYEQKALIGHLYAFYLLAQFRETRAYPLIAELFLRHGDRAEEFCGDFVTEDLARVLASVFDGDLAPIKQLIETTTVNDWVRSAAVSTLTILTLHDQLSRNEVIAYFRELLTEKLERQYNEVWNGVIIEAWHLYPDELQDEIAQAYEEGFADESMLGASAIGEALATDQETHIAQTRNNSHYQLITDTIAEMEWWAAFRKPQARSPKLELPKLSPPSPLTPKSTPLAPKPSIGRNDPCHCGSGKKYKKCCWPN